MAEMAERLLDYFDNATFLVWLIYPTQRYALVYRCAQEPDRLLKSSDYLEGEEIMPEFRLLLGDLFQPLSF